jgi:GT2 family glycosyltransferase
MEISIVFITRNRWDLIYRNIDILRGCEKMYDEIVILDNNSKSVMSGEYRKMEDIRYVRLRKNFGVPDGRNIAAKHTDNKILLFIDDDGFIDLNDIEPLYQKMMNNTEIGVISLSVKNVSSLPAGDKIESSVGSDIALYNSDTFHGGACLINKKAFFEVGGFPADFEYLKEEQDISLRLLHNDYDVLRTDDVWIRHYAPDGQGQELRDRYRLYWRLLPIEFALYQSLICLGSFLFHIAKSSKKRQMIRGILSGFASVPVTVLNDRSPIDRTKYINDARPHQPSTIDRIIKKIE